MRQTRHVPECEAHKWNIRWLIIEMRADFARIRCNDLRCRLTRVVSPSVARKLAAQSTPVASVDTKQEQVMMNAVEQVRELCAEAAAAEFRRRDEMSPEELAAVIRAVSLPETRTVDLAAILAAVPQLTGDEVRDLVKTLPQVASEWHHREWRGFRRLLLAYRLEGTPEVVADWAYYDNSTRNGWTEQTPYQAVTHLSASADITWHATQQRAQAWIDAQLQAAGVRLCGEVVTEAPTDG